MLYIIVTLMVFMEHGSIPGADSLARAVGEIMGGSTSSAQDMDPLVAAVVALPYWVAIQTVLRLLVSAGRAGQGREGEKDWMDE